MASGVVIGRRRRRRQVVTLATVTLEHAGTKSIKMIV
jgi:hypothetical protein